jgi:cytochrome c553
LKIGEEELPRLKVQRPEAYLPNALIETRKAVSTTQKMKQIKMKRNFDLSAAKHFI